MMVNRRPNLPIEASGNYKVNKVPWNMIHHLWWNLWIIAQVSSRLKFKPLELDPPSLINICGFFYSHYEKWIWWFSEDYHEAWQGHGLSMTLLGLWGVSLSWVNSLLNWLLSFKMLQFWLPIKKKAKVTLMFREICSFDPLA